MTNHLTYGLARLMDDGVAEPGGPHRFLLSSPGTKRDGLDLGPLPFLLQNFNKNPVGLMAHDYGSLPVARGEIEKVQTSRGESLIVTAWLDVDDPLGRLIDHKIRNNFLHAVSLGWDDVDARGIPVRVSGQRAVGHDVLEFSFVAVPGDADATKLQSARSFVSEAIEVLPETDERRADLNSLLEQIKVCEGEACEANPERGITSVNHFESGDTDMWAGTETVLPPSIADAIRDAVIASLEAETEEEVWLSLDRWSGGIEPASGTNVSVDVSLPPEVLRALFQLAIGEFEEAAGRSAEPSGNDADPPIDAEALTLARRQQTAMAAMFGALWVEDANDADDKQRQESRRSLIPEYERLGLVVPAFLPARAMAALSQRQRSALFPNGEMELMTTPTDPQARGGKAISKARKDRIRSNATAIADAAQDLIDMLDELDDTGGERSAEEGRGCGCGSGSSHTSPQSADPTEAPEQDPAPATEPASEPETEDPLADLTSLLRELDPRIRDVLSRALEATPEGEVETGEPEAEQTAAEATPETRSGDEPDPETDNTAEDEALRARLSALLNQ